jgi:hypothetical protein
LQGRSPQRAGAIRFPQHLKFSAQAHPDVPLGRFARTDDQRAAVQRDRRPSLAEPVHGVNRCHRMVWLFPGRAHTAAYDHQPPGLQFGLQFTAVRSGSLEYTHVA